MYFGYKKNVVDTEDLEKSISALKTGLATNNTKTKSLETSLFKKDGTVQMTGDLDLGDNSIVGIHDINAQNSVPSKKYVDDKDTERVSRSGDSMSGQLVMLHNIIMVSGQVNMDGKKIINLANPTTNPDAANKKYVDDKTSINSTNITSLASRVTSLESQKRTYTYHFDYFNLGTSWSYPRSSTSNGVPYHWMFCKGLNSTSKFHVHSINYDADASIENSYIFTFKLDFFNSSGNHWDKEIFTAKRQDHIIPGESIMFVDKKFTFHGDSTLGTVYTQFELARLTVKGTSTKGNEFTVSCSFEI